MRLLALLAPLLLLSACPMCIIAPEASDAPQVDEERVLEAATAVREARDTAQGWCDGVVIPLEGDEPRAACVPHDVAGPLIGPGSPDQFQVTCLEHSAVIIQVSDGRQVSYDCQLPDDATANVRVGKATVTGTTGQQYSAGENFGGNLRYEYCTVESESPDAGVGSVVLECRVIRGQP